MRYLMALIIPLILLAVYNARADGDGQQSSKPGRYEMERTEDGYVRLDTQTGAMSLCQPKGNGWACEAVPDDRLVLEEEIQRLDDENRELRDQVAGISDDQSGDNDKYVLELPSKEDVLNGVDQAGEIASDTIDRVQAWFQDIKKQMGYGS